MGQALGVEFPSYRLMQIHRLVASGVGVVPLDYLFSRARARAHVACQSRIKTNQPAIHLPAYIASGMR